MSKDTRNRAWEIQLQGKPLDAKRLRLRLILVRGRHPAFQPEVGLPAGLEDRSDFFATAPRSAFRVLGSSGASWGGEVSGSPKLKHRVPELGRLFPRIHTLR